MSRYENRMTDRELSGVSDDRTGNDTQKQTSGEDYKVQTSRLYHIAESFIQAVQEFL
jgi:hypothetical protein